jgi:glyoxylase-like metal-dependent hydrolase (beta-lactamase superfamily II)
MAAPPQSWLRVTADGLLVVPGGVHIDPVRPVDRAIITHGHSDHSPLAAPLAEWAGCKTYSKHGGIHTAKDELGSEDDLKFKPDVEVGDGTVFSGPGWTLDVIETPGHTTNHLCFGLREENACFSGDHVMGWSTTVVAPPDGNMGDYMRSLEKIRRAGFDVLWPTHGNAIRGKDFVETFITEYANHRKAREASILAELRGGETSIPAMVARMYKDVDLRLHPAAAMSVLGHMLDLIERGMVVTPDKAGHAVICNGVAAALGGRNASVLVDPRGLSVDGLVADVVVVHFTLAWRKLPFW